MSQLLQTQEGGAFASPEVLPNHKLLRDKKRDDGTHNRYYVLLQIMKKGLICFDNIVYISSTSLNFNGSVPRDVDPDVLSRRHFMMELIENNLQALKTLLLGHLSSCFLSSSCLRR